VIGERNLDNRQVEYKNRRSGATELLVIDEVLTFVNQQLKR
jgi:prolyl-tRNA synthetase